MKELIRAHNEFIRIQARKEAKRIERLRWLLEQGDQEEAA